MVIHIKIMTDYFLYPSGYNKRWSTGHLLEASACFGQRHSSFGKGITNFLSFQCKNRSYGLFELGNLLWVSGTSIV